MQTKIINPWTWQDQFSFSHAVEVTNAQRLVFCAGQTSVGPDGEVLHRGDMRGQMGTVMDNLETVLGQAGLSLANVVRLNVLTRDVDQTLAHWDVVAGRLRAHGVQPASTLFGVTRLAGPDLLIEIEATAAA